MREREVFALVKAAVCTQVFLMFPASLFAAVIVFAIVTYSLSRRKSLRAPGLREAMFIIGTGIVLFVIWLTMMR